MEKSIKVWDWPTRLFHWSLVLLFGGMWFTGEQGGDWLQYHIWSGEAIAVLLLFRLIWGVMGSETARFSQFVKGPAAIRAYLQGKWTPRPGHNPLGGADGAGLAGCAAGAGGQRPVFHRRGQLHL
jgi:cytochrome b